MRSLLLVCFQSVEAETHHTARLIKVFYFFFLFLRGSSQHLKKKAAHGQNIHFEDIESLSCQEVQVLIQNALAIVTDIKKNKKEEVMRVFLKSVYTQALIWDVLG